MARKIVNPDGSFTLIGGLGDVKSRQGRNEELAELYELAVNAKVNRRARAKYEAAFDAYVAAHGLSEAAADRFYEEIESLTADGPIPPAPDRLPIGLTEDASPQARAAQIAYDRIMEGPAVESPMTPLEREKALQSQALRESAARIEALFPASTSTPVVASRSPKSLEEAALNQINLEQDLIEKWDKDTRLKNPKALSNVKAAIDIGNELGIKDPRIVDALIDRVADNRYYNLEDLKKLITGGITDGMYGVPAGSTRARNTYTYTNDKGDTVNGHLHKITPKYVNTLRNMFSLSKGDAAKLPDEILQALGGGEGVIPMYGDEGYSRKALLDYIAGWNKYGNQLRDILHKPDTITPIQQAIFEANAYEKELDELRKRGFDKYSADAGTALFLQEVLSKLPRSGMYVPISDKEYQDAIDARQLRGAEWSASKELADANYREIDPQWILMQDAEGNPVDVDIVPGSMRVDIPLDRKTWTSREFHPALNAEGIWRDSEGNEHRENFSRQLTVPAVRFWDWFKGIEERAGNVGQPVFGENGPTNTVYQDPIVYFTGDTEHSQFWDWMQAIKNGDLRQTPLTENQSKLEKLSFFNNRLMKGYTAEQAKADWEDVKRRAASLDMSPGEYIKLVAQNEIDTARGYSLVPNDYIGGRKVRVYDDPELQQKYYQHLATRLTGDDIYAANENTINHHKSDMEELHALQWDRDKISTVLAAAGLSELDPFNNESLDKASQSLRLAIMNDYVSKNGKSPTNYTDGRLFGHDLEDFVRKDADGNPIMVKSGGNNSGRVPMLDSDLVRTVAAKGLNSELASRFGRLKDTDANKAAYLAAMSSYNSAGGDEAYNEYMNSRDAWNTIIDSNRIGNDSSDESVYRRVRIKPIYTDVKATGGKATRKLIRNIKTDEGKAFNNVRNGFYDALGFVKQEVPRGRRGKWAGLFDPIDEAASRARMSRMNTQDIEKANELRSTAKARNINSGSRILSDTTRARNAGLDLAHARRQLGNYVEGGDIVEEKRNDALEDAAETYQASLSSEDMQRVDDSRSNSRSTYREMSATEKKAIAEVRNAARNAARNAVRNAHEIATAKSRGIAKSILNILQKDKKYKSLNLNDVAKVVGSGYEGSVFNGVNAVKKYFDVGAPQDVQRNIVKGIKAFDVDNDGDDDIVIEEEIVYDPWENKDKDED